MRVAFIDPFPKKTTNSWTQTVQYLKAGFRKKGVELVCIEEPKLKPTAADRLLQLSYLAKGKKYLFEREPDTLKQMATQIDAQLVHEDVDIIFCASTLPLAYIKNPAPKVAWTDSSFGGLVNLYEPFSNVCKRSLHNGHLTEREAMTNCAKVIFSSDWAVDFACDHYRLSADKFTTIPLGANLEDIPAKEPIATNTMGKSLKQVELLFVGYDWDRKGGSHAVQVHRILRSHGIDSRLSIVGCTPQIEGDTSQIELIGKLDKHVQEQAKRFKEIMMRSHFLVLPSQADCTAIVFSEAAAYGIPAISTNVGGHSSIITNGTNGMLFPPEEPAKPMSGALLEIIDNQEAYLKMAGNARSVFDDKLSWAAGIERAIHTFEALLGNDSALSRAV